MYLFRNLGVFLAITISTSAWAGEAEMNSLKARELAALMLNMNGLLCAKVVEIRPLKVRKEIHEVRCVEYRGGTGQKTYILDSNTGQAWRP